LTEVFKQKENVDRTAQMMRIQATQNNASRVGRVGNIGVEERMVNNLFPISLLNFCDLHFLIQSQILILQPMGWMGLGG
jgi:hypothetical protein